jgi:N-acetylmuramic acid 6-phosphate etherase
MALKSDLSGEKLLGIEGGATRTVALMTDGHGAELHRVEAGPANLKLLTDAQLAGLLKSLAASLPRPHALAIGLAGAWTEEDRKRIRTAASKVWPGAACYATNDLETAITAAALGAREPSPRVLLVSGTGSCCCGQIPGGKPLKVGGWGHILGDKGSGYEIGLRALKAVLFNYDLDGNWPDLGQELLRALQLNEPSELVDWVQSASKADISSLALEVFRAWDRKDKIASQILAGAAASLVRDAITCARRLGQSGKRVEFVLAGSILLKQKRFAASVARQLRRLWPQAVVTTLKCEGVWGAVELARRFGIQERREQCEGRKSEFKGPMAEAGSQTRHGFELVESSRPSPTEGRNARSMNLDRLPLRIAIEVMLSEESKVTGKLLAERGKIDQAVRLITRAFQRGGRLFYVGAGTSGRLGVLDASECPPTFRTPPQMVQGIIAGGQSALWKSVEGAEDNVEEGVQTMEFRAVGKRDVVVGIAASGRTPFVWGALQEAKARGAATILVCFNPYLKIPRALRPTVVIATDLGAEVLSGSTRLKAGTATKIILNMLTTLAMVRLGKVMGNLMIDMQPANAKLRDRAIRIVQDLTGMDAAVAHASLRRSGWIIKKAVGRLKR